MNDTTTTPTPAITSPWMSKRQAQEYLGLCDPTLTKAIKTGRLRACRILGGQKIRLHRDHLDQFLLNEITPSAPNTTR
jgi:excisionase family DNA binding protein